MPTAGLLLFTTLAASGLSGAPPAPAGVDVWNLRGAHWGLVIGEPIPDDWLLAAYGGMPAQQQGTAPARPDPLPGPPVPPTPAWPDVPVRCGTALVTSSPFDGTTITGFDGKVRGRTRSGRWANALVGPPACSPNGRYVAVVTPYEGSVSIIDVKTGQEFKKVPARGVRETWGADRGPAVVTWRARPGSAGGDLVVRAATLPYE